MSIEDKIICQGEIIDDLTGHWFKVKLDNNVIVNAYLSGKMQRARVRCLIGDRVECDLSPYDLTKARIRYRWIKKG